MFQKLFGKIVFREKGIRENSIRDFVFGKNALENLDFREDGIWEFYW